MLSRGRIVSIFLALVRISFSAELSYSLLNSTSKTLLSLCFRTLKAKIRSTDAACILLVGWLVGFVDGEMKCITFRTRACMGCSLKNYSMYLC